jgi:hypothetical protein
MLKHTLSLPLIFSIFHLDYLVVTRVLYGVIEDQKIVMTVVDSSEDSCVLLLSITRWSSVVEKR